MNLSEKSLAELSHLFQDGTVSSREIVEAFITNIESCEDEIDALLLTTFDQAREMANAADSRQKSGKLLSPLDGMPIIVKDNYCTQGVETTAASKILKGFVPPYDATAWKKLKDSGMILLGKANCDEFAMGGSNEHSGYKVCKNPHDLTRVAGGSSGGSAASIAANFAPAALGSDTGGSIRQPASYCGLTGLKVSYGRVSRYGVTAMASSLDSMGPMAKTPEDCAMLLQAMAGADHKDSTTPDKEVPDYLAHLGHKISDLTIGLPKEYFIEGLDEEVAEALRATKKVLEDLGCTLVDISLPHTAYAVPAYYVIMPCEASANLSRYDGIRYGAGQKGENLEEIYVNTRTAGFGDEVKRRIMLGTYALSAGYYDAYYKKAQKVRTLIKQDFDQAFEKVDLILTPVAPTPAFEIGRNLEDPLQEYLEDIFTVPASLAGICGLSVPVAKSSSGLPIGAQLLGPAFKEQRILRVGHHLYKAIHE